MTYPKRLIEVDLPIRRISAHARREKSIRHGHISTLHIWWARRPLAACRAVICAALWPDPVDENCPQAFRDAAGLALCAFAEQVRTDATLAGLCRESWSRWNRTTIATLRGDNPATWPEMRYALLDFIADFANWDASTVPAFLETARLLTHVAHLSLSDPTWRLPIASDQLAAAGHLLSAISHLPRPFVVDPFAGGGSIPLEALRVGADAFASDLNPVAVLLNKVVLEYIPKYGQRLADEVRKWGAWIKEQAEAELAEFYPKDPDGATPIAYLWARTITCEGPGCGAEVPLMRSLWLAKKGERSVALRLLPDAKRQRVDFEIIERRGGKWVRHADPQSPVPNPQFDGTVRRGSATCPVCGYTTPVTSVRRQLKPRRGGAADARLFCVVTTRPKEQGRFYRLPTERDLEAVRKAAAELERRKAAHAGPLSLVPDEPTPQGGGSGAGRAFSQRNYGMDFFEDLYTPRQLLALVTFMSQLHTVGEKVLGQQQDGFGEALQTCVAMALDRQADHTNSLCTWNASGPKLQHLFTRAALPVVWDFAEAQPFGDSVGDWLHAVDCVLIALENASHFSALGHAQIASATAHPLPDDTAHGFFTDPPYYDAIPYADLADFFYVWLKRTLALPFFTSFEDALTPKSDECILDETKGKDRVYFEKTMKIAMSEGRRVLAPGGVGLVVFANKSTAGWEAQLQAMIESGWVITGSWPIDTELATRLRGMNSAALASSVHLVCRPRPDAEAAQSGVKDQVSGISNIGDWRDVLAELPARIHAWMPRLAQEGVVGADAIFACLGPALEIFSRYSRVEKASGESVALREYLEYVWAAVSHEALTMIFEGADASGFEEDARLTAMWLWTLSTGNGETAKETVVEEEAPEEDEEGERSGSRASQLYALEFDAARKIAQGLGAHLERLTSLVQVKGETARLLAVSERTRYLFGKEEAQAPSRRRARPQQLGLFAALEEAEEGGDGGWGDKSVPRPGATVLDRVHQAMILFAAGRSEALKRFLVAEGAGDVRFWRLAQALSALYPSGSEEKRWVDGVLARKKGLGF